MVGIDTRAITFVLLALVGCDVQFTSLCLSLFHGTCVVLDPDLIQT